MVLTVARVEHIEQMVGARRFALPMLVFLVIGAGAFTLHAKLRAQEAAFVQEQVEGEAIRIEGMLRNQAHERLASLGRMAARWTSAGGTDYALWRADAANHVAQLPGLRALEWIDAGHRVRWVEPALGNEMVVGLDVRTTRSAPRPSTAPPARQRATLTPPLDLKQGYAAFIAYLPMSDAGTFDGFLAGVFAIEDFFTAAMRSEASPRLHHHRASPGPPVFQQCAAGPEIGGQQARRTGAAHRRPGMTLRVAPTRPSSPRRSRPCPRWCWPPACWWRRLPPCRCATYSSRD